MPVRIKKVETTIDNCFDCPHLNAIGEMDNDIDVCGLTKRVIINFIIPKSCPLKNANGNIA